eukprot:scaffold13168_cov66-Cyclotella_meneghiniana.AAC.12
MPPAPIFNLVHREIYTRIGIKWDSSGSNRDAYGSLSRPIRESERTTSFMRVECLAAPRLASLVTRPDQNARESLQILNIGDAPITIKPRPCRFRPTQGICNCYEYIQIRIVNANY